jgi:hypothetical protein
VEEAVCRGDGKVGGWRGGGEGLRCLIGLSLLLKLYGDHHRYRMRMGVIVLPSD